jgi:hypothetical protein
MLELISVGVWAFYTAEDLSLRESNSFPAEQTLEKHVIVWTGALTNITFDCVRKQFKYFVSELLLRDSEVSTSKVFEHFSFPTV